MDKQTVYWVWFQQAAGYGTADSRRLLETFGTAEAVYKADSAAVDAVVRSPRVRHALSDKALTAAERIVAYAEDDEERILTYDSPDYPKSLRTIFSPPAVLYMHGQLPPDDSFCVGIVGTRHAGENGLVTAFGFAAGLAGIGCPVISGGAMGIDGAAHSGAVSVNGVTVAVQACGLRKCYPHANEDLRHRILKEGGVVLSEFAPNYPVYLDNFRRRNRLISGFSRAVLVVEAPETSGALITARYALEQGRQLFAVPGAAGDPNYNGSHRLIRDGAVLATKPSELLSEFFSGPVADARAQEADRIALRQCQAFLSREDVPSARSNHKTEQPLPEPSETAACPEAASTVAHTLYAALRSEPLSAEDLVARTDLTTGEVFSGLTELELYGCIHSLPGQRYSR